MADKKKSNNGQSGETPGEKSGEKSGAAAASEQQPVQIRVAGQFIKDLSFENPSIGKMLGGPGDNPNLKVEVNVGARRVGPDLYETGIEFSAKAVSKDDTIYDMELVYCGLFEIRNIPEPALEPFLLINCPTLLFPFLRRIISDITRDGGFPPLLLDPIDFAGLYMRRQQEQAAASSATN